MANKEAIVFILDANLSTNAAYPPGGDGAVETESTTTRLSQAKEAVLTSIIDLMWRSKTHEAGLVVLKTGVTHHHLSEVERIVDDVGIGKMFRRCGDGVKLDRYIDDASDDDVFPNIVEFGLNRPAPCTLRAIKDVQCTINDSISPTVRGDLCDGLILAADTLHRRTAGKKYKRKIVMITDAEHTVEVNGEQLSCVLDGLNSMDVELIVVGIGFQEGVIIPINDEDSDSGNAMVDDSDEENLDKKPEAIISGPDGGQNDSMIKEEGNADDMIDNVKRESDMIQFIKRENEKLLLSIAQETGGCILAANGINLTDLLQTKLPCLAGTTRSVGKKSDFRIAPNLSVMVKSAKLTDNKNLPAMSKEAYQIDPKTGEKLRDGGGELMTLPTKTITEHFDDEGNMVSLDKRTDAYRYGCDLIPVGKMDMLGINAAFAGPPNIEMIGYIDKSVVESSNLLMGPAYAITGGDSKKARTAIAALSRALEETGKVGFCRIVRMKNGDPKIGALLPKLDGCDDSSFGPDTKGKGGWHLVFLELPFADDLSHITNPPIPLEYNGDYNDEKVCDDLIDSMMLPDDELQSEEISFPALKAYQSMVAHLAMNPMSSEEELQDEGLGVERILEASHAKPLCEFDVVKKFSEKATKQIDAFKQTFQLVEHKPEDEKKRKFWGDSI